MKQALFIALLFTGIYQANAQTDSVTVWNKWCLKPDTALLFPTANNLIQIHSATLKATDIIVKSLDNALKIGAPEIKNDTMSFMAMPYPKYGKRMRLTITDKKTKKLLKTVNFAAEDVPKPIARVGNIATTEGKRRDILAQKALKVAFANSQYCYPYYIKAYTFKTRIAGKDIIMPVKGFQLTKEVINILTNAPDGAFIEFTDIKASCPECSERSLDNIRMWIR